MRYLLGSGPGEGVSTVSVPRVTSTSFTCDVMGGQDGGAVMQRGRASTFHNVHSHPRHLMLTMHA